MQPGALPPHTHTRTGVDGFLVTRPIVINEACFKKELEANVTEKNISLAPHVFYHDTFLPAGMTGAR